MRRLKEAFFRVDKEKLPDGLSRIEVTACSSLGKLRTYRELLRVDAILDSLSFASLLQSSGHQVLGNASWKDEMPTQSGSTEGL